MYYCFLTWGDLYYRGNESSPTWVNNIAAVTPRSMLEAILIISGYSPDTMKYIKIQCLSEDELTVMQMMGS